MKKQKLTPEQYKRANRVLMVVLSVVYVIFALVELNAAYHGNMAMSNYIRIGLYLLSGLAINVFVRIKAEKKSAMLFMAIGFFITYTILVFGNGPGAMAMMFPVLAVFMIYLNAPLIFFGSCGAFLVCLVKAVMLKSAGDEATFSHANLIMMGIIICIFGSRKAINLIITFIQEDKQIIEERAAHQEQIANVVSEITDNLNEKFQCGKYCRSSK